MGSQLTSAHQQAQVRLAEALALVARRIYAPAATPDAAAAQAWVDRLLALIVTYRAQSASLGSSYVTAFARAEGFPLDFAPERAEIDREQIRRSLYATGVGGITKRLDANDPREKALSEAAKEVVGASMRHALNGARGVLATTLERDSRALGWVRVTREGCCAFCATLASRGAIYKGDSFDASDPRFKDGVVPSDHKVHDNCRCFLEPIYSRTAALPGRAEEFSTLWHDVTSTFSGRDKLRAFRRTYEALQRGETREQALARGLRRELDDPSSMAA